MLTECFLYSACGSPRSGDVSWSCCCCSSRFAVSSRPPNPAEAAVPPGVAEHSEYPNVSTMSTPMTHPGRPPEPFVSAVVFWSTIIQIEMGLASRSIDHSAVRWRTGGTRFRALVARLVQERTAACPHWVDPRIARIAPAAHSSAQRVGSSSVALPPQPCAETARRSGTAPGRLLRYAGSSI